MSAARRRGRLAAATTAIVAAVALVASGGVMTDASWQDREVVHGRIGTVDCATSDGAFATRAEGRMLTGSMLGTDLDTLAAARGIVVTNDGERSRPSPANASPAPPPDAYSDPMSVEALGAINVELFDTLRLPLDNGVGVVGQYAQATSSGIAVGAAGAVASSGGIALEPEGGYPELATLRLSDLLAQVNPAVASTLAGVTDVSFVTGAVTGRAALDSCAMAWTDDVATAVTRDYLAASLRTEIESPTAGALVEGVVGRVDALQEAVDGLGGDAAVTDGIAGALTALLNGVLSGPSGSDLLRLGSVSIDALTATIDLSPVRALATAPFGDSGGALTVDPATGTVSIDTAALLAAAYPGQYHDGLNGLPPNTNLLADPAIANALTAALTGALADWIADIEGALAEAIDSIAVSMRASIALEVSVVLVLLPVWVPIGAIEVAVSGDLGDLLSGDVLATAQLQLLGGLAPVVTSLLNGLLKPVLDLLLNTLINDVGALVGGAVHGALASFAAVPPAVAALTAPIVDAVSLVYRALFLDGVVAVTVNAQNDPVTGLAEPADWAALPDGRFDVAGLRIGVLGALGANDAHFYLGRGSVGPGCTAAEAPTACASY